MTFHHVHTCLDCGQKITGIQQELRTRVRYSRRSKKTYNRYRHASREDCVVQQ